MWVKAEYNTKIDVVMARETGAEYVLYVNPQHRRDCPSEASLYTVLAMRLSLSDQPRRHFTRAVLDEESWERAIGLVVCGLAERIQL
jgi:hypothetical protein